MDLNKLSKTQLLAKCKELGFTKYKYKSRNKAELIEIIVNGCESEVANENTQHNLVMKPSQALAAHRQEIRQIVLAHRATNARVFGSVANGSDTDESDLDILVDTTADTTLFDLGAIRYKLRKLLGVSVDVLTPGALPDKFRDMVIAEALTI